MLAVYIRIMLLLELAAYVAIAEWLHFLYGWSYGALAALALAALLLARLAMVSVTTALAFAAGAPMRPEHKLALPGVMRIVAREWRAILLTNFAYFPWDALALRRDPPAAPAARVPVVMVHGYLSNRGYFRPLVRNLEARGVAPIFAPNLPAAFVPIEEMVGALHREIERIAAGTGQRRVVLVCHSMGGVAARAYLCSHGAARVARLVTIASPHHGTVHAYFGAGSNARQMRRGSRFFAAMRASEGDSGPACPVTSIYTPHDNLVAPQETSRLPWAKNIVLPGLAHVDILRSPRLAEAVFEELREAGAAA